MNRSNWLLLTLLSFLWGAVYLVIAVALRGFPPVAVVFGRVFLAVLVLSPLAIRRGVLSPLLKHCRWVLVTVLVQSTAPLLLLTYGQQWLSAGLTGVLIGAQPLFVAALAVRLAPGEKPGSVTGAVGLGVGFAGIALLFYADIGGTCWGGCCSTNTWGGRRWSGWRRSWWDRRWRRDERGPAAEQRYSARPLP